MLGKTYYFIFFEPSVDEETNIKQVPYLYRLNEAA